MVFGKLKGLNNGCYDLLHSQIYYFSDDQKFSQVKISKWTNILYLSAIEMPDVMFLQGCDEEWDQHHPSAICSVSLNKCKGILANDIGPDLKAFFGDSHQDHIVVAHVRLIVNEQSILCFML